MLHQLTATMTSALFALHGWPVYLVIAVLAFAEAAVFVGLVLPGETALFLGGVLAFQGNIQLGILIAVAVVAAVVGDSVGYEIGRHLGPAMKRSRLGRWIGADRWSRAEDAVARRGVTAVVAGRWVGVLRALVPAVAGASGMPYRRFLAANAVGGVLWAAAVATLGFAAGAAWTQVQGWLALAGPVVLVGVVGWFAIQHLRRRSAAGGRSAPRAMRLDDHPGATIVERTPDTGPAAAAGRPRVEDGPLLASV